MDKLKIRRDHRTEISQLGRAELETAYMNLLEMSLQKTELVKDLEKQLSPKSTREM